MPQSLAQLLQLSSASQVPSPQTLGALQSKGQLNWVSPPLHLPSPQKGFAADALLAKKTRASTNMALKLTYLMVMFRLILNVPILLLFQSIALSFNYPAAISKLPPRMSGLIKLPARLLCLMTRSYYSG